jgi:hypothetical protein
VQSVDRLRVTNRRACHVAILEPLLRLAQVRRTKFSGHQAIFPHTRAFGSAVARRQMSPLGSAADRIRGGLNRLYGSERRRYCR